MQAATAPAASGEPVYLVLLALPVVVAVLLALTLVAAYVFRLLPGRRREILEWFSDEARECYRQVFRPRYSGTAAACILDSFDATQSRRRYLFATLLLLTSILGGGVFVLLVVDALRRGESAVAPVFAKAGPASAAALSGALIWGLYELIARVWSRSVDPEIVQNLTLRLVAAIPIGVCMAAIVKEDLGTTIAFASAAFPLRETRQLLRRFFLKNVAPDAPAPAAGGAVRGSIGDILDGFSENSAFLLTEVQIDTYLDLAYADPIRLMARTGLRLRLILTWIDQALLAAYAPAAKTALARAAIPCALDAVEFFDAHFANKPDGTPRDWQNDPAVLALAEKSGLPAPLLREVFVRVREDPHVQFLGKVWYLRCPAA